MGKLSGDPEKRHGPNPQVHCIPHSRPCKELVIQSLIAQHECVEGSIPTGNFSIWKRRRLFQEYLHRNFKVSCMMLSQDGAK